MTKILSLRRRSPRNSRSQFNEKAAILLRMASESDLKRAREGDGWLLGADLSGADLEGVDLSGACLDDADLSGAKLSNAKLYEAELESCNLRDAVLKNVDLRFANLKGAILSGADLRGADLRNARLVGAAFDGADLRDANLTHAIVYEFHSSGTGGFDPFPQVDISRVARFLPEPKSWVETADLSGAILTGATMPDGKKYASK